MGALTLARPDANSQAAKRAPLVPLEEELETKKRDEGLCCTLDAPVRLSDQHH